MSVRIPYDRLQRWTGAWREYKSFAYLVPQSLASDDSNFVAYSLVGLEVESELWVVSLDNDLGGLLDCLRSNATHLCG